MKIGILSFTTSSDNYGQLLQCYALEGVLKEWGHTPYHVRYVHYLKSRRDASSLRRIIWRVVDHLNYRYLVDLKRRIQSRHEEVPDRGFDFFRQNELEMSSEVYCSIEELRRNPPEADAYVAGSDQIWGIDYSNPDSAGWFLKFGAPEVRRLSYAASIGRSLTESEIPLLREQLSDLDCISVREAGAQEECHRCGVDATVVLDPTLLLRADDYRVLSAKARSHDIESPYMFAYILNVLYSDDIKWDKFDEYARQEQLEVYPVYSSGYYSAYPIIRDRTPLYPTIPEWIRLIENASCVVTTSFHGVVFCILFRTPFIALPLPGSKGKGNDRILTLLRALGLSERMFCESKPVSEQMKSPIDWDNVHLRLNELRESSLVFLGHALA